MIRLERFGFEMGELTEQELTLVAGGAEPTQNRKTSLFRARTEVKDSHDRYANIEVSYQQ
jgi:hypothetical protein